MDSGKITNKLIGDSYPPGKKSTEKKLYWIHIKKMRPLLNWMQM